MSKVNGGTDIYTKDCPLGAGALNDAYDVLKSGNYDRAFEMFSDILQNEPDNTSALKGKMLCELKVDKIEEIRCAKTNHLEALDIDSYLKAAPEADRSFFDEIAKYKYVKNEITGIDKECNELRAKIRPKYQELVDVSREEAKRELFTWDLGENACYPTILGLIVFVAVVIGYVYYCNTHDAPFSQEIIRGLFIGFIPAILSIPAVCDIFQIVIAPSRTKKINKKYSGWDAQLQEKKSVMKNKENEAMDIYRSILSL